MSRIAPRRPRAGTVAQALRALADLAPQAEGTAERYSRLLSLLGRKPALAASRMLALGLAVEALEVSERLIGDTDDGEVRARSAARGRRHHRLE